VPSQKTHESPELVVTAARSAELHQPTAAAMPVPVIEADRPGTVESLIAVSYMSAVLSCTRFSP